MRGKSIKEILFFRSRLMVYALVLLLLPINFLFYLRFFHEQQRERSTQMFHQIEQTITMNEADLSAEKEEYSELCISKAGVVAHFVKYEPEIIGNLEEMRELARIIDVDEIHFFNKEGEIFTGTHPEYYSYSVYSGEQMGFFKQMLEDTTLEVCQDIMPNTAEQKEMQYAAVWLEDESAFVQIGMRPERLLTLVEEKSIHSIVRNIPFETAEYFHIIDISDGKVVASSSDKMLGYVYQKEMEELKDENFIKPIRRNATYKGENYCVFMRGFGKYLLVHSHRSREIRNTAMITSFVLLLSILFATIGVIWVFIQYINRNVVNTLLALNRKLQKIETGDLEKLDTDTAILEMNTLVYYINQLLQSIRFDQKRIKDIFNSGQISLGIFEYNSFYKKLFLNQQMKNMLGIHFDDKESYEKKKTMVLEKMNVIKQNCVDQAQEIYQYDRDGESLYVNLTKYTDKQSVIYYLEDVSSWWNKICVIQDDSLKDVLTGLFNRRGIQENFKALFANQMVMKEAAVVMVDADGLKEINDVHGHAAGDAYLKAIAAQFISLPKEHTISARLGGDEFVMLIYGYDSRQEVDEVICELYERRGREFSFDQLEAGKLEFSMGCAYFPSEGNTSQELMSLADDRMYTEKRGRKSGKSLS